MHDITRSHLYNHEFLDLKIDLGLTIINTIDIWLLSLKIILNLFLVRPYS